MAGLAVGVAALVAAIACSSSQPAGTFKPAGGASADAGQPTGDGQAGVNYTMPPFGSNVHIEMTSWLPGNAAQKQAVITDKDYELAFLYAEYKGGQDQAWTSYVSPVMQPAVTQALKAKNVTTQSFRGTVRYFNMRATPDPLVHGDLDVSSCFDNAGSSNTNLTTGTVLPDTSPPNSHYVRITDELRKTSAGQWQVVSTLLVYYPTAKECKP
jgi:hypothetical protein